MQHIVTSDAPALALDDIMHSMSPSPTPAPRPPEPSSSTSSDIRLSPNASGLGTGPTMDNVMLPPRVSSPEPLEYSELEALRTRMHEYTLSSNVREAELAGMVRLSVAGS
ncbi:hypothetical protein BN946_scf184759.g34 [Trametes cinnabarina]|uniref:Uncharacterized protein n=1 Tax=Pycnoporus cinnabarinus TaxID=5643 RepID=A0A060SBC9_PYCCI|nr:hypothetical protein BN946_scf184759.g34 [Trametes cinnabarina]